MEQPQKLWQRLQQKKKKTRNVHPVPPLCYIFLHLGQVGHYIVQFALQHRRLAVKIRELHFLVGKYKAHSYNLL